MEINIVALDQIIYQGKAEGILVPAKDGQLTILPNHIPLITVLKEGKIVILGKEKKEFSIREGILMVKKNKVDVLVTV